MAECRGTASPSPRPTLPGRVEGRLYDEWGGEVRVRADAFERIPYDRRPRIYDHTGLRVVGLGDVGGLPAGAAGVPAGDSGTHAVRRVADAAGAVVRLLVRVLSLLARIV